jgi:hypothetical protein
MGKQIVRLYLREEKEINEKVDALEINKFSTLFVRWLSFLDLVVKDIMSLYSGYALLTERHASTPEQF